MRNIKDYVRCEEFKMIMKNNIIYIENFDDIGNISQKEIIIYNDNKKILIKGNNLSIDKLLNSEILIKGRAISVIAFCLFNTFFICLIPFFYKIND